MKDEALKKLNNLIEIGLKKKELEERFGMPLNSLSGFLSGSKVMPEKYFERILNYNPEVIEAEETSVPETPKTEEPKKHIPAEVTPTKEDKSSYDKKYIDEWARMLIKFHTAIEGSAEPVKVKEKLNNLAEQANNSAILTPRQREGIYARCKNYLSGNYGKDSVKDNYIKSNKA